MRALFLLCSTLLSSGALRHSIGDLVIEFALLQYSIIHPMWRSRTRRNGPGCRVVEFYVWAWRDTGLFSRFFVLALFRLRGWFIMRVYSIPGYLSYIHTYLTSPSTLQSTQAQTWTEDMPDRRHGDGHTDIHGHWTWHT
ncbi:hypothetical protein DFP72DRAFT_589117 [Ephemerocybe angulata]|uniref:Secreted protein n=1 Tax=Ephemerocybe angulata TaxID=980116 RepID=A0A8H6HJ98_9AGAR|nr:hypothetical protein DFP72DRAFT_589117 [Tulosesus angulatus]